MNWENTLGKQRNNFNFVCLSAQTDRPLTLLPHRRTGNKHSYLPLFQALGIMGRLIIVRQIMMDLASLRKQQPASNADNGKKLSPHCWLENCDTA